MNPSVIRASKDQHNDVGIVHVFIDEGSKPSWDRITKRIWRPYKSHEFWTDWEFIQSISHKIWWKTILREILNVKTIDCRSLCWSRSTLAHDQVKRWSKARVRVYSDSVLCLGKMSSGVEAKATWSSQVKRVPGVLSQYGRISGHWWRSVWTRVEYFSKNSQHCKILQQIQNNLQSEEYRHQNNSLTESSSCQKSTTSNGQKEILWRNLYFEFGERVKLHTQRGFRQGHWTFIGNCEELEMVWNKRVPIRSVNGVPQQ